MSAKDKDLMENIDWQTIIPTIISIACIVMGINVQPKGTTDKEGQSVPIFKVGKLWLSLAVASGSTAIVLGDPPALIVADPVVIYSGTKAEANLIMQLIETEYDSLPEELKTDTNQQLQTTYKEKAEPYKELKVF